MAEQREADSTGQRYVYLIPTSSEEPPRDTDADASLQNLWRLAWERRRIVVLFVVLCVVAGTAYSLLVTPWYKADVVLSPADERSLPASLSGLSGLGDLASLAGITLPSARGDAPLAVLKSKGFARAFIEDQKLMPVLFADKWDAHTGDWKDKGPDAPDIRDGVKYFDEKVRVVTENKKAGLVTLSIQWKDPALASSWANMLVKRLNDRVRSEAIHEAETSIGYLQKEILATNVVSLQQAISKVLESEMQKMALARANEEFAFKVVDEAFPPKRRYFPQRTLIVAAAALLGGMLGMLYVAVSQLWRHKS